MSNNKNLLGQLAAARERAKADAEVRTPRLPPVAVVPAPPVPPEPTTPLLAPESKRTTSPIKAKPASIAKSPPVTKGQGTLERTTITLKLQDRSVLSKAQTFFIERGIKAPPSSTLIRLALYNLAETLEAKPESVQRIFDRIRREDGRRNAI